MKRVFSILFAFCFMLFACGCGMSYDNVEAYIGNVQKIELIEYENANAKQGSNFHALFGFGAHTFEESKCTVLEELSAEKHEAFIAEFFSADDPHGEWVTDSPSGQGVRITLKDNSFTVITWGYAEGQPAGYGAKYNANGVSDGTSLGFKALASKYLVVVAKYFETKIEMIKYN